MIEIRNLKDLSGKEKSLLFNRFGGDFSDLMMNTVAPIVNDVKRNGEAAVLRYTEKFDGVRMPSLKATREEIDAGAKNTPPDLLAAFREARENIWEFHSRQKREHLRYERDGDIVLGIMYQPIESAAVYVPGGKASYPSSVLMGVIPAKIAGTENITVVTPPGKNGRIPDILMAVCRDLGVTDIIKAGGAQGIAAAAFGAGTGKKADIVVGPGNVYVTAAKTYLFSQGIIQIDSLAGPSEVLIIADEKSDPRWIAYDLLSQAEHEETAKAILLTPSPGLAARVKEEIVKDIRGKGGRHEIKKKAIEGNGLILITGSIGEALEFSNAYAPEHMELMVDDPLGYLDRIKNVGSLFLGRYAPVAIGDYYSGTNHILPTGGSARFSSGTSVETYMRRTTFQCPTKDFLRKAGAAVNRMADIEGFKDKHGGSIDVRISGE